MFQLLSSSSSQPLPHRLDRRAKLAARVEELELLQVGPEVVGDQVGVLAEQPRVRGRLRRREPPPRVYRQQLLDQVLSW